MAVYFIFVGANAIILTAVYFLAVETKQVPLGGSRGDISIKVPTQRKFQDGQGHARAG